MESYKKLQFAEHALSLLNENCNSNQKHTNPTHENKLGSDLEV
jgi:hypothetical protein